MPFNVRGGCIYNGFISWATRITYKICNDSLTFFTHHLPFTLPFVYSSLNPGPN